MIPKCYYTLQRSIKKINILIASQFIKIINQNVMKKNNIYVKISKRKKDSNDKYYMYR